MGCNCGDNEYNITVNNNGNYEPTTPIYNITLANVGVNGYSPIVRFVNETVESFNIAVDNITGTETSPAVPKLSYVADQINNVNSTIAGLDSTYLTRDGSNASNPIVLNHLTIGYQYGSPYINSDMNLYLRGGVISLQAANDINLSTTGNSKAYYNNNEIATLSDIPSVTGFLNTDGSNATNNFTVNGVELAGNYVYINNVSYGGINISQTNSDIYATLTVDSSRARLSLPSLVLSSGATGSITLNTTKTMYLNSSNADKIYYHGTSNSNELATKGDIVNTTYTAGTGIDITNDVISVDENDLSFLKNESTAPNSLSIWTTGTTYPNATNIGGSSVITTAGSGSTALGYANRISSAKSVSIGSNNIIGTNSDGSIVIGADANINSNTPNSIQIGKGTNSTANSLAIGFNGTNYQLLDGTTGLIPDDRLSSNIARTSDIGNGTITLTQGGVTKGTFTVNQNGNSTIELDEGGSGGTVDQTFNPTSTHAQSGKAVAEAISTKQDLLTSENAGTDIEIVNRAGGDDTVSGTTSILLEKAVADGLNSVTVSGRCEQTATPTPSSPIPIVSNNGQLKASANLFDQSLFNTDAGITITYYTFSIGNGTYTMSTNIPYASGSLANVFLFAGQVTSGASSGTNGVTINTPRTITVTNGKYTVAYRSRVSAGDTAYNPKNYNWMLARSSSAQSYQPYVEGGLYVDGITETITDSANNSATAEMLLSIGDYTDTQEILSGAVTRKVGVIILDGTEDWGAYAANNGYRSYRVNNFLDADTRNGICTHLPYYNFSSSAMDRECVAIGSNKTTLYINLADEERTVNDFKTWLAQQYAAGTPVMFIYPLATETTETVTGQTLTTVQGDNTLTISQASIDNLPIEANYNVQGGTIINFTGTIPTVNNATITITQGGVTKGSFTTNQSGNATIALDAGGGTPSNMVTTNTAQTITGVKTFDPNSNAYIKTNQLRSVNDDLIFYTGNRDYCDIGYSGRALRLFGSATRPQYTSDEGNTFNNIALSSDIPTVNNSTITFTQGGTTKGTITLNQSSNQTIAFDAVIGAVIDGGNA